MFSYLYCYCSFCHAINSVLVSRYCSPLLCRSHNFGIMTTLNSNVVVKNHKSYYCSYGCLNSSLGFVVNSRRRESNEVFSSVCQMCAGFAVRDMERGSRLKLTGESAVWISLTSSASSEREPTVRCTKQKTKTQVCCLSAGSLIAVFTVNAKLFTVNY